MVRLQDVGLHYVGVSALAASGGGPEVLRDLSFAVPDGGFRWLLGPSGAGKTSLLRLLHLAVLPSRGQLTVLGTEVGADGAARRGVSVAAARAGAPDASNRRASRAGLTRLRRRIGMVFQDFRLLAHLSAFDNVALPLRIAGRPEGQIRADVAEMLRWVGLAQKLQARPAELSGGEQQRVAIARAVVSRPDLLLADEPTGNLDEAQAERVMQLLDELNRLGTTVIVATHSDSLVARLPHLTAQGPALRLERGRLLADG